MSFANETISDFLKELSSKSAVPGGGGAAALSGAIGISLGAMVGNLTLGKKSYAQHEAEIMSLLVKSRAVQGELLRYVDEDAEAFEPLSHAYSIPKNDPRRQEVMERALKVACSVPLETMRACGRAIEIHARLAEIGSSMAISDVGVGLECCKGALKSASLNVFINTTMMTDRDYAHKCEAEARELIDKYCAMADAAYERVLSRI